MQAPSIINSRYRVVREIGAGTLARVFHCLDTGQRDREVAVKTLFPDLVEDAHAV